MEKTFEIKDGKIYGLTIDDVFTSRSVAGTDRQVKAKWCFDGLELETVVDLIWANAKVKLQAASLKKMSDREIDAVKGQTLMVSDYIKAESGGRVKALERQAAEQAAKLAEVRKTFVALANSEAIAELGDKATADEIKDLTIVIFKQKYEHLC